MLEIASAIVGTAVALVAPFLAITDRSRPRPSTNEVEIELLSCRAHMVNHPTVKDKSGYCATDQRIAAIDSALRSIKDF